METVKKALPWVQELKAFVTRRASIDEFNRSCRALIRFVNSVLGGGPTHVGLRPKRRLMDHIDVIRFSFRTIHQKVTLRRFPRNYSEMWAYIGLPISEVTSSLSVSQGVISRRRRQYGICLPAHSDTENVLLAVQVFSIGKGRVTRRIHVGASRGTSLLDIHKRLRVKFHVSNTKRTALYVEVKGIRYGPLWKPAQWNEVLTHGENTYKINLLFVVWKTVTSIPVSRYLIYAPGHKEDHGGVPEAPSGSNVAPKTGKPARSSGNPNGVTSQTMNRDIRQESTKQRICNKMDANTPKYFKGRYEEIVKDVYKSGGIGSVPVGRIETGVIKPGKELEKEPEFLKNGDAGMVKLLPTKHMVAETFAEYPVGRFVVRDMRQSVAVRVIKSVDKKDPSGTMVTKAAVKKGAK